MERPMTGIVRAIALAFVLLAVMACGSASPPSDVASPTVVDATGSSTIAPGASAASTPSPVADLPFGARITGVVPVPNNGALTIDEGAVWAIDRGLAGDAGDSTEVTGQLIRIDPTSLETSEAGRQIIGAQVAIEGGSAWIASAFLDSLLRIDLEIGEVTKISTGELTPEIVAAEIKTLDWADNYPYAVVAADSAVWVANHHAGSVVRFDATTGELAESIPVLEPGGSGPANLVTDGTRVWVTASRSSKIFEIDASTNTVERSYDVGPEWACGGSTFDGTHVWVTSGHDAADPCHEDDAWAVSRVDLATGEVVHLDVGGRPLDVAVGLGSVWVATDKPHPALVRLDPKTLDVVGRLPLPLVPNITNPMEVGEGAVWLRGAGFGDDEGLSPWPGVDRIEPAVLRIEPEG
jgi:DNA-binding beta-propeller fold protein YncE